MNYKEAFLFVAGLLPADEQEAKRIMKVTPHIDWTKVVQIASSHLVFPTLYLRLKQFPENVVPKELIVYFKNIYNLNRKRNLEILNQVLDLNDLLNKYKIKVVFIKGAACFIDNVFQDIGERMIGDIDLLVPEKDFIKAVEVCKSSGYIQSAPFFEEQIRLTKHYPRLLHPKQIAAVEIHRQPVDIRYSGIINNSRIFLNKKTALAYNKIYVPDDRDKVIINYVHSQISNKGNYYGAVSLRYCYEFFLLQNRILFSLVGVPGNIKKGFSNYLNLSLELMGGVNHHSVSYKLYRLRIFSKLKFPVYTKLNTIVLFVFQTLRYYSKVLLKSVFINQDRKSFIAKIKEEGRVRKHIQHLFNEISRIAFPVIHSK